MAQFSADELSLIRVSGHIYLKMMKDREKKVLDKMYGQYCNGTKDFLAVMAEYATIRGQIHDMENALAESNKTNVKEN